MPRSSKKVTRMGLYSGKKMAGLEIHAFTLRVQKDVIDQIDAIVSKHPVIRNRNTWIVNAIVEQLKRERESS